MNFLSLLNQAQQVAGLIQQGTALYQQLSQNYAAAKAGLSETEQGQLQAKLDEIHQANLALSAELDSTMAQLERRS